ncbi:putative uncharacterized membrane protein [Helianthus annuus]|nr:putative uncharacterized membrane protein [Helianthus annuus]
MISFLTLTLCKQESSFYLGLCYIVAALSLYDEYSNDVLDMPEGSCFPKPKYRRNPGLSASSSFSMGGSSRSVPSRAGSVRVPMIELKSFEVCSYNIFYFNRLSTVSSYTSILYNKRNLFWDTCHSLI